MATETKVTHTPGPWNTKLEAKPISDYCIYGLRFGETDEAIAEAFPLKNSCGELEFNLEQKANALLISLSPELLAELKLAVSRFEYNPGHSDLDNEQPIHLPITLGDYRRINMLIHRAEGK